MSAHLASAAAARAPEFKLADRDFAAIARLVYDESGIVLNAGKTQLVHTRLAKRLRARGLADFASYVASLDHDAEERAAAVDALTTNHTKFFRENHHFEHFVEKVWPALRRRLGEGGRVRIWSAACSSGEEPYTLMMSLLGTDAREAAALGRLDFRILATDLSREVLRTAQAARYPKSALDEAPPALRGAWTKATGDQAEIHPAIRELITFRPLNLLQAWPMKGRFDVIFCRNVMIYFDEPTKAKLQARFAEMLVDAGHLYIGHSERLLGTAAQRFAAVGQTIYRKAAA